MKIEIKARITGSVIFSHDAEPNSLRITVEEAVSARANLSRANLSGANLYGADLSRANLSGANLDGADLDDKSKLIGDRPILQIGPIGSRCAYFVAYLTDNGLRLRAGCFFGTRAEFLSRLENSDSVTQKEYRSALHLIDTHEELFGGHK